MIKHPPYVYTMNFSDEIIDSVKSWYAASCTDIVQRDNPATLYNSLYKLTDLTSTVFPGLLPYLSDEGLVLTLHPGKSTPIHVDNIAESKSSRNIVLNFPISMCESVTEFYAHPMLQISKPKFNIREGIVPTGAAPDVSFSMREQAVLLNSREFHKATNLSSSDTRVVLSCSFNVQLSFNECVEILKSLSYAE